MKRMKDLINIENLSTMKQVLITNINVKPPTTDKAKNFVIAKITNMNNFYKEVTGMNEVEYYQARVVELEQTLQETQQKRREMSYIQEDLQRRNHDIQEHLRKVDKHSQRTLYIELIHDELENAKKSEDVSQALREQDKLEKEMFLAYTNAIRDSMAKERTRSEYAKYIGIGLTITGAFLSYVITTWRTEDLKNVIRTAISTDVKSAFIETSKENLKALQKMNQEHLQNQNSVLERIVGIFKSDLESTKVSNQSKFQQLESSINSTKEFTFRLASKLNPRKPPPPAPQPSTWQWTWGKVIGISTATLIFLRIISSDK